MILHLRTLFLIVLLSISQRTLTAQDRTVVSASRRLNIAVSNKSTSPNAALMSFHSQAWLAQLLYRKRFRFIIASSFEEAVARITSLMEKEKAMVGALWFDGHGHMGRRTSLMQIGDKEVNAATIHETDISAGLQKIGQYCDTQSHVSLGTCYSGAAYYSAGTDGFPPRRMDGDLLMLAFRKYMNGATIYGSVSWVMTGLGVFNSAYTMAGHPGARRFRDVRFRPAWDSLGVWCKLSPEKGFEHINTVALSSCGNIVIKKKSYLQLEKAQRHQARMLKKLKPELFPDRFFYEYREALHHRR